MTCGKQMTVFVPSGWDYKEIMVRCGDTSPNGDPYTCDVCDAQNGDIDWEREAEENGERYDPLD